MPVISAPEAFNEDDLYIDLRSIFGHSLFLKSEGFNFAGSIKLKAATEMVDAAERDGILRPDSILVESSSGNLGVALSMIAASRGYRFLCVTDPRCNLTTRRLMEALGSHVHIVAEPDAISGFLGARIDYVRQLCDSDERYVWLDQYNNPSNWKAHYRRTAPAIARHFPQLDVLFVGAGTTGTLMGCARYFREWHRPVRVVAVDAAGSVTFGDAPGRRMIPGLGMSMRPPLLDESYVDEVVRVEEVDTVRACHRLARRGFLFGGSTGTVVSGAMGWLAQHDGEELTAVAIAPDLGERYLDTVYQTNWLQDLYGKDLLTSIGAEGWSPDSLDQTADAAAASSPDGAAHAARSPTLAQGAHVMKRSVEDLTPRPNASATIHDQVTPTPEPVPAPRAPSPRCWLTSCTSSGCRSTPLLRRPGCRLAGDGPVLRAGAEAGGPAVGVDEGHLPAPDDQQPGDGARGTPRRVPAAPGPRGRPSRRCWPASCTSSGCRSTATSSTTWARTRW